MTPISLPPLGLGTWQLKGAACERAVRSALEMGYTLADTAQMYGNEKQVGEGLRAASVDRDDVVVATKLSPLRMKAKNVRPSARKSLQRLGLDRVDLLYVHWPAFKYNARTTLPQMAKMVEEGSVGAVCVSNFTPPLLDEAINVLEEWGQVLGAHQVEFHPLLRQEEMRRYLKERGIPLVAYSPLGRGLALKLPEVLEVAKARGIGPAQVVLAWERAHGAIPIPKATSDSHLKTNLASVEVELTTEEVAKIDGVVEQRRFINPPFVRPNW